MLTTKTWLLAFVSLVGCATLTHAADNYLAFERD
jgi:hypothetical protein